MDKELLEEIKILMKTFKGFINYNFELILDKKYNIYTNLNLLKNKRDLIMNILEWKSRPSFKFDDKETKEFRKNINKFLSFSIGKTFTREEFEIIYTNLGNGINRELTEKFIDSDYNLNILKGEDKVKELNLENEIQEIVSKPINYNVPVKDYQNANIVFGEISEEELIKLGFRNNKDNYYLCKDVVGKSEITFNLTIYKKDKKIKINVLDENYLQPYDYQNILRTGYESWDKVNDEQYPYKTHVEVQKIMKWLLDNKVIKGYVLGDYI